MDDRDAVVRALRTTRRQGYDPLDGLRSREVADALPEGLDLEQGARRLLDALKRESPGVYRRLLVAATERLGLYVGPIDPRGAGKASEQVEQVLAAAAKTTEHLRGWVERAERQAHAVVVRRGDPGSEDPAGRCASCRVPALVGGALARAEADHRDWSVVLVPGEPRKP